MDLGLRDKVVFITGASGGIGRAMAGVFAAEGARLVLHGHARRAELDAWLAEQDWADRAVAATADIRDPEAVSAALELGVERWGRVDVALANAGVWPPGDLLLHELPPDRLRTAIDTNLMGAVWTARAFMAALSRTGPRDDGQGASLIFTGSTAGRFGEKGHADYAASKAGLVGLVRTLKNEIVDLDPFARVNMIEPGWTVTHMARPALEQPGVIGRAVATMPVRQLGRAVDIASTAAWLASPLAARHVSGQIVTVAGGMEGRVLWGPEDVDEQAVRNRATEA